MCINSNFSKRKQNRSIRRSTSTTSSALALLAFLFFLNILQVIPIIIIIIIPNKNYTQLICLFYNNMDM